MKRFLLGFLVLACFALIIGGQGSASAASFIKIDGIKGESKDKGHEGWIEIRVKAWDQVPAIPFRGPSGLGVGSVSISKEVDMSSTQLVHFCNDGKHIDSATLHWYRTEGGLHQPYKDYILFDVTIEDCAVDGKNETVTLTYDKIQINYTLEENKSRIEGLALAIENERQQRMMDAAAEATGRAADAEDDKELAAKEISAAIIFLTEAARECADVKAEAMALAGSLKAQGGLSASGVERLGRLFDLLAAAKKAKSSDTAGSFEQASAIREIILGIYSVLDTGFHDFWHSQKALEWYINAISSNAYARDMIAELLDYLIADGDMRPEKKAEILDEIDDFADKVENDRDDVDIPGEVRRLKDLIADEVRRASEERRSADEEALRAEEEAERRQGQSGSIVPEPGRPVPQPTTSVQLTSLEGPTEVSRRPIGALQSVHIIAIDGTEMKPDRELEFTDHKDTFTLDLPWDPNIFSVIFGGASGSVQIFQDRRAPDGTLSFGPRDREIITRNTNVNETISTRSPDGQGLVTGPLDDYVLTIDGQPVDIVAGQPDEIAIEGSGIQPNPSGKSDVVLLDEGMPVASGTFESWGYEVSAQEVTERNVWTPIYFLSIGVAPTQFLKVTLRPTEGQTIEPTEIILSGAESSQRAQIARLMTDKLGPQVFFVEVEKTD